MSLHSMAPAQAEACADAQAQLATVSAIVKLHEELAELQRIEWDRYVKELNGKASSLGWSDSKKREVMMSPLRTPEYLADELLKRPYQLKLEAWMQQLAGAPESGDLRRACLSADDVREASKRFLELHMRQYKLAFRMLAEE
jgi:hypothetical protein